MAKSLRYEAQRPKFVKPSFFSKPETFHYLHHQLPPKNIPTHFSVLQLAKAEL